MIFIKIIAQKASETPILSGPFCQLYMSKIHRELTQSGCMYTSETQRSILRQFYAKTTNSLLTYTNAPQKPTQRTIVVSQWSLVNWSNNFQFSFNGILSNLLVYFLRWRKSWKSQRCWLCLKKCVWKSYQFLARNPQKEHFLGFAGVWQATCKWYRSTLKHRTLYCYVSKALFPCPQYDLHHSVGRRRHYLHVQWEILRFLTVLCKSVRSHRRMHIPAPSNNLEFRRWKNCARSWTG